MYHSFATLMAAWLERDVRYRARAMQWDAMTAMSVRDWRRKEAAAIVPEAAAARARQVADYVMKLVPA